MRALFKKGCDFYPTVIGEAVVMNRKEEETGQRCYSRYQDLVSDFHSSRDVLNFDGPNIVNGHIISNIGVVCNREDLPSDLKQRKFERKPSVSVAKSARGIAKIDAYSEKKQPILQKLRRQEQYREKEAIFREKASEAARKIAEKIDTERKNKQNRLGDLHIQSRCNSLATSRRDRRQLLSYDLRYLASSGYSLNLFSILFGSCTVFCCSLTDME